MRNMNRPLKIVSGLTAAALTLSACTKSSSDTEPSSSDNSEQSAIISIDCPIEPGHNVHIAGAPGRSTFEFTASDNAGSKRVIGRLSMHFEVAEPGSETPKTYEKEWSFPTDDKRLYSYGISDLPNIHTESGVYELSIEENPGGDSEYELDCTHRTEPWPSSDLAELHEWSPPATTS